MKKSMNTMNRRKTLRYGGTAAAFTVAFVAIVIIANVIFTALATKYRWYLDLSSKELFTLSDATVDVLETAFEEKDAEVTIIFCMEKDELIEDAAMMYIQNTAENLANKFKNIKIKYMDSLRDYDYMQQFVTSSSPNVYTTNVIVQSGTEYRKLESHSFFVWDTDETTVWAYKGENTFASAILQVTADEMPIAYFTKGHMEKLTGAQYTPFIEMIEDAGYEIKDIDLSTEELDPAARLLIINDPETDFGGALDDHTGKSEIEKIDDFLDNYGAMMVFVSPDHVGKLTNLSELLEEWGIGVEADTTVKEAEDYALSVDGFTFKAQYNTSDESLSSSVYKEISNIAGGDRQTLPTMRIRDAAPITHKFTTDEITTSDFRTIHVFDMFTSSGESRLFRNGALSEEQGQYSVMTISQGAKTVDNEIYLTHVLVSGTPSVIEKESIEKSVYKNRDIINSCLVAFGKKNVPVGIEYKEFEDYDLDITVGQANAWTRAFIIIMPAATVIACVVVTVRRKYR